MKMFGSGISYLTIDLIGIWKTSDEHDFAEKRDSYLSTEKPPDVWEEEEYGVLLNGTDWEVQDLQVVQDFLDRINTILEPIANACTFSIEHCWYNLDEFEVAYIQLINGKLTISGKRF